MKKQLQEKTCTCVIPFYNEHERILTVLKKMSAVKNLSQIICIDDGSTDNTSALIKQHYPHVQIIRNERNLGKSAAVFKAFPEIKTQYVLLFDADIYAFKRTEIERALEVVFQDNSVDMLILRRKNEPFFVRFTRGELVLSGERLLSTQDFREVYKQAPQNYQLEIAINLYMVAKRKKVFWFSYSGRNTFKTEKVGLIKGLLKEIQMYRHVISYIGYKKYLYNLLFFCKAEYPQT